MPFQTAVNLTQGFGVPGQIFATVPHKAETFTLVSAQSSYNIMGATCFTITSEGVAQAGSGGTMGFAGFLVDPAIQPLVNVGAPALSPTLTVQNNKQAACLTLGSIVVTLPASANIGDVVIYDNTTGAISTVPIGNSPPTGFTSANAIVDYFVAGAAGLAVIYVSPSAGAAGAPGSGTVTSITGGTGLSGGTITGSGTLSVTYPSGAGVKNVMDFIPPSIVTQLLSPSGYSGDVSSYVNAAIANGGCIEFPSATYNFTSPIANDTLLGTFIRGANQGSTVFKFDVAGSNAILLNLVGTGTQYQNTQGLTDVQILVTGSSANSQTAVDMSSLRPIVTNVTIQGAYKGFYWHQTVGATLTNVDCVGCFYGHFASPKTGSGEQQFGMTECTFVNCHVLEGTGISYYLNMCAENTFIGGDCEDNSGTCDFYVLGNAYGSTGVTVKGMHFEVPNFTYGHFVFDPTGQQYPQVHSIEDCDFHLALDSNAPTGVYTVQNSTNAADVVVTVKGCGIQIQAGIGGAGLHTPYYINNSGGVQDSTGNFLLTNSGLGNSCILSSISATQTVAESTNQIVYWPAVTCNRTALTIGGTQNSTFTNSDSVSHMYLVNVNAPTNGGAINYWIGDPSNGTSPKYGAGTTGTIGSTYVGISQVIWLQPGGVFCIYVEAGFSFLIGGPGPSYNPSGGIMVITQVT